MKNANERFIYFLINNLLQSIFHLVIVFLNLLKLRERKYMFNAISADFINE